MSTDDENDVDVSSGKLRRRTYSVKIHLTPQLYKRLDDIAERRGFPLVSLLALIAGEYVEKVNFDLQTQRMVALEVARCKASERRPL